MNYDKLHYGYWEKCSNIVKECTNGEINPILWHKKFNKNDVYLAFSGYFYGTWENSGRFFHQVNCWVDNYSTVISMFNHFGMSEIGLLYARAVEIEVITGGLEYEEIDELVHDEIKQIEIDSLKGDQYKIIVDFIDFNFKKFDTLQ